MFLTTAAGPQGTLPAVADQLIIPGERIHLCHHQHIPRVVRAIPLIQTRQLQFSLAQARLQQVTTFLRHLEDATWQALKRVLGKAWSYIKGKAKNIFFLVSCLSMNLTEKKSCSCLLALKQVLLRPLSVAMNKFSNLANKYSLTGLILNDIESGELTCDIVRCSCRESRDFVIWFLFLFRNDTSVKIKTVVLSLWS